MKKAFHIAEIVLLSLILVALLAVLLGDGVYVFKGFDGVDGINGTNGTNGIDGADGQDGTNGKSAYELAVEDGFRGTLHEWLLSLAVRGGDGEDGRTGSDGVGVRDVYIDGRGNLIVVMTDGRTLDAGYVGSNGGAVESGEPDADGYYPVYETVIMNGIDNTNSLYLRTVAGTGEIVTSIDKGDEILRVGDQKDKDDPFSRLVWNGQICYARSKFFDVKYVYNGEIPELQLPERLQLTLGKETWLYADQMMPYGGSDFSLAFSYSGAGSTKNDSGKAFGITPTAVGEASLTVSVQTYADGEWRTVASHSIPVSVASADATLALTGILIGDGRISNGTVADALGAELANLTLLGTHQTKGSARHEGYTGWGASDFRSKQSLAVSGNTLQNAFYSAASEGFDFSAYMAANYPTAKLDFAVIRLGMEDGFSKASVEDVDFIVRSIKQYDSNIKVLVMGEYLSPRDGYLLDSDVNVNAMRALQFDYHTYQRELLGERESEGVYLLENRFCTDAWQDFVREEVSTSQGTAERVTDAVHPSREGYLKETELLKAYIYGLFGTT